MTRLLEKINPATGLPGRRYEMADEADIGLSVRQSHAAFSTWKQTPLNARSRFLRAMAKVLYRNADRVAAVISAETGKPVGDSLEADIGSAISILNYYADIGPRTLASRSIRPDTVSVLTLRTHREVYHPRGILAIISPWNYPLAIPVSGMAAALMAGNTVILKPSELTPETGLLLVTLAREVLDSLDLPRDALQVIIGDGQTGDRLLEELIDGVIFTGSSGTGRKIREKISGRGLWSSLELGGSDAMLILPGCPLERAASYAIWGRFTNAGQACASVKRLLVPAGDEKKLLGLLQEKMASLRIGTPEENPHVGPLISEAQLHNLEAQVRDAVHQGARLILGGKRMNRSGFFYEPTLLADVPPSAHILQEEVFGPVLPVIPYRDIEEAVSLANQSTFGLTASIFGPVAEAGQLAERLACATVVINDVGTSNYATPCAPWGGWKESGHGVSHGERTLLEMSRIQVVSVNGLFYLPGFGKPFWHFAQSANPSGNRGKALLALLGRHPGALHPRTWLALWNSRASTKI